jgi:hypothetical protein
VLLRLDDLAVAVKIDAGERSEFLRNLCAESQAVLLDRTIVACREHAK